jgi:hypothetical protein
MEGARLFIYAYSELEGVDNLLHVEIAYGRKITVSYSLVRPATMAVNTFAVVSRHFEALDLGRRYAKQASTTIAMLLRRFRTPENLGLGVRRLQQRLQQMAIDRSDQCPPNHWEVSLLAHLAGSPEFTMFVFS